jgi:hypothetical protein
MNSDELRKEIDELYEELVSKLPHKHDINHILYYCREQAYGVLSELVKSKMNAESGLIVGLMKWYKIDPQNTVDFIEAVLGWRLYQNVHHKGKWCWGVPPSWLGGEGNGWTWKSDMYDFEDKVIKALRARDVYVKPSKKE